MNKNRPFDFDKEIQKHQEGFRQKANREKAVLDKMLEESDRRASTDPRLGINYLLEQTINHRECFERTLQSIFGYEVPFDETIPGYFVRPERRPSNGEQRAWFVVLLGEWAARELAFEGMIEVLTGAERRDKDAYLAVRKECVRDMGAIHDLQCEALLHNSYAKGHLEDALVEEEVIAWFAGSVAARISLQKNGRLRYALEKEGGSPYPSLLRELPAATLIELQHLVQEKVPPSSLVKHVARNLANMGSGTPEQARDERLANIEPSDTNYDESTLEEFLANEELNTLKNEANLSEKEYQVLELRLEGKLYREIADELEIPVGTVKSTMYDIREKLRQAAGQ